jgi:branched-chain amino acid transport system permease protein
MGAAAVVAFLPVSRRRLEREVVQLTAAEPEPGAPLIEAPSEAAAPPALAARPPGATPGRAVIECVDVTRSFGGLRALQGVTLAIHEGELVGLVGPNGSGKTTLVNLISGVFRPTSGEVLVDGRSTSRLPPHRIAHLGVARTYQIPRPFESMTVRDNVAMAIMFGRAPHTLQQARLAADEHLELVGLGARAAALPHEINLHERQLLEMARALATRPRVLLLDEALAGLSPVEIDNAAAVVRRIHDSGITIVLVEHLLRVVNQLATRIVVLDQGRALADGEPRAVMADPAVIRAYLGSQAGA